MAPPHPGKARRIFGRTRTAAQVVSGRPLPESRSPRWSEDELTSPLAQPEGWVPDVSCRPTGPRHRFRTCFNLAMDHTTTVRSRASYFRPGFLPRFLQAP